MMYATYFALGIIFGILCGMSIGGGTILVPLLLLLTPVNQLAAQGITLVCYLPSAAFSLVSYVKQGRVYFKAGWWYIIGGIFFAIPGAIAVNYIPVKILKKCFGIFLIIFSASQILRESRAKKPDSLKFMQK